MKNINPQIERVHQLPKYKHKPQLKYCNETTGHQEKGEKLGKPQETNEKTFKGTTIRPIGVQSSATIDAQR